MVAASRLPRRFHEALLINRPNLAELNGGRKTEAVGLRGLHGGTSTEKALKDL